MRVLYFTGSYRPDSMISHTHGDLVAALRALGVEIEIATTGPPDQPTPIVEDRDRHGTTVRRLRVSRSSRDRLRRAYSARLWSFPPFATLVAAMRGFFTPERLMGYDILHVGMAYPYATAVRHALGNRRTPPALVTITGGDILTDEETGYGYGKSRVTRAAIRRTLLWAALVQANSPRSAQAVIAYGCPASRVAVQPPQSPHEPIPTEQIAAIRCAARNQLEATGAISPGRLLVGFGRMEPIKAYDDVIRAMPEILRAAPDTTALFAGPVRTETAKAYVASLHDLARRLGVAERVTILPQVPYEEVPHYFAAADLALIPSLLDGLNKTGIEAAAVGTPCVVSTAAGLADYVREYGSGTIVPPRDPDALSRAIIGLLNDDDAWRQASAGAHALAEAFSVERTAAGVLRLYEAVSSQQPAVSGQRAVGGRR